MPKRPTSFRISVPARNALFKYARRRYRSATGQLQYLVDKATRESWPKPGPEFRRWHDLAGTTIVWSPALDPEALANLKRLASRWGLSEGDTVEYLVWRSVLTD